MPREKIECPIDLATIAPGDKLYRVGGGRNMTGIRAWHWRALLVDTVEHRSDGRVVINSATMINPDRDLVSRVCRPGQVIPPRSTPTPLPATPEFVEHTCNPKSPGKPRPYGRRAPQGECPRCDELHAGATPREVPAHLRNAAQQHSGYPSDSERERHFAPGGPHRSGACGPVCTFGDW
jgi:hypothetical protein